MSNLYGAKCHLCSHLTGPTHDRAPDIWPLQEVTECDRCIFCQEEAFGRFLIEHTTEDDFGADILAASRAFRDGRAHPLIAKLRAECLAIEEEEPDYLNSPEFMDWIQCQETAVKIGIGFFQEILPLDDETAEKGVRALMARWAKADITLEWNRE